MGNKNKRNVEGEINALDKVIRSLSPTEPYTQPKTRWSMAKHNGMQKSEGFCIDWEGINEGNSSDPLIEAVLNRVVGSDLMRKTKFNAGMYCSLAPVLFQAEDGEEFKFEAMHQIQNMIVWSDTVFGEPESELVNMHKKLKTRLTKRNSRNFGSILYEPCEIRRTNTLEMERVEHFTEESEKIAYSFQENKLKNLRLESETVNEQDSMNSIHKIVHTMEDRGWTRKKTCSFEDSNEEIERLQKLKEKQRRIRAQRIKNDLKKANKQFKTVFKPQKSVKFISQLREEDADKLQSSLRKKHNIKIDLRKVDEVVVVPDKEETKQKIMAERLENMLKPRLISN